jgi:ATP-dependent Clp protease ATP-binding subunit ClpA
MFERYTEKSIKVIMLAQEESRRLGHNYVGTEQLLLGTIGEGTGIGARALQTMGVTLKTARIEVEKIIGRGAGFVAVEIPFTPRAKRVLELSLGEARQLGHIYIGTEHLLLGLIREGEGVAIRVLKNLGVDSTKVRTPVIQMLGETRGSSSDPIDTEEDTRYAGDRLLDRDDFSRDRRRSRRRERLDSQAPMETAETNIMLRSILHRTIAIERNISELRAEIVALGERVGRIEGKIDF